MKRVLLLLVLSGGVSATAQVPSAISFQGLLADDQGGRISGTVDLTMSLYVAVSGGTPVWSDHLAGVTVVDGIFGVLLGPGGTPPLADVPFDVPLYLGITVNAQEEMTPRVPVVSVPYARRAATADGVDGPTLGDLSCSAGQSPLWNGSAWECGEAQRAITGSCPSGSYVRAINTDGTVVCEAVGSTSGPCPAGMAAIEGFCIDKWEAYITEWSPYEVPTGGVASTGHGSIPQGYISGDVASTVCQAAGKRLCSSQEWLRACRGPSSTTYPYGNTYDASACNEGREVHPVLELFGPEATWSSEELNDPRLNQLANSLAPAGTHPGCVSADGVYDLHGNLHEWVADVDGTFRGGFYVDAKINGEGCLYVTTAHNQSYHDYSTGFRCCADQ